MGHDISSIAFQPTHRGRRSLIAVVVRPERCWCPLTKIGWQAAVDRCCSNGGVASCDG